MLPVEQPFKTYTGLDGKPLDSGYVYFGQPNQDPITKPVTVFWDAAGTLPAAQPLRTVNGYIMNAGTPANLFFDGAYSELVQDKKRQQVFYARTSDEFSIATAVRNFILLIAAAAGSALMGFIQAGAGAIARTVQDELRDVVRVSQFGAKPDTGTDQGPKIAAAHAYAMSINADLEFPGGVYTIGPGTSFTIDPQKTRWVAKGPVGLRWSAVPTSGVAVTIVAGEVAAYETVRTMVDAILSGIDILGSPSSGALFNATGLRIGDGTHQTNCLSIEHVTISGWTNVLDYTNNVWWICMRNCRLLWGTITTPAASGNWGESNSFDDCVLADGVVMTLNYGEWKFYSGSLDNGQVILKNNAYMNWHGPHFENPGQTTLAKPFIDIQGVEATCHLISPQMVINNAGSGTPITTSPFNVTAANTNNGLILDGIQYTQGGYAQWYSLVSGGGRVTVRAPQILALSNANYQVIAENARGQLRNGGFETGDMSGWTITVNNANGTSTATVGSARVRPGSTGTKSCLLTVTKTQLGTNSGYGDITIEQKAAITAGERLMWRFAYNRQYTGGVPGSIDCYVLWQDADGNQISSTRIGYLSAPAGTDDGAVFSPYSFNGIAPGGTTRARLQIQFGSATGIGTANLTIDDVIVNVVA